MKFPRNARIFRGQLDAAPFAIVFSCLLLFLLLSSLVYTPGVPIDLPAAGDLPGTDKPMVSVAMDRNGRLYFDNQCVDEADLRNRLRQEVSKSAQPLTLLVEWDKAVTAEQLTRLTMMAREVGINDAWLATLPRPVPVRGAQP